MSVDLENREENEVRLVLRMYEEDAKRKLVSDDGECSGNICIWCACIVYRSINVLRVVTFTMLDKKISK